VTIRHIELAIIEKGFESGYIIPASPVKPFDERVAIIGAGPAGLAVADTLNRAGYGVTVFDSARHPGGILTYGIPDFKLEKWVVERRVKLMEEEGVLFETGVRAGDDISCRYLKDRFDAICLACGARKPRDLLVPGRELKGIYFAMDYLTQQNRRIAGEPIEPSEVITAEGKTVVVIGGGDTGSDCLGTALRQGAKKVYQFEILPKPPGERPESTPWPMWPLILRETPAHKEGGEQRWSVMTKEFSGENGVIKKLRCAEVEWQGKGEGEQLVPVEKSGTEFEVQADMVVLAMGFVGPEKNRLIDELGIEMDTKGNVKADAQQMTNVKGVFVAGDMALGQSLVVRAIANGRRAAKGIVNYLMRNKKRV
jgi:glutamate synthase (NADPH/NADH) small chain